MSHSKRFDVRNILMALLLVLFFGRVVDSMSISFAIRIPKGTPLAVTRTGDGGKLLLLELPPSSGNAKVVAKKMNRNGDAMWETGFRVPLQSGQKILSGSAIYVNDGNNVISITRSSFDLDVPYKEEVFFIKLSRDGEILWQRGFGGTGADAANLGSVNALQGGFVAAGGLNVSDGTPGVSIASFNRNGTLHWGKIFSNFLPNLPQAILRTPKDNVYVVSEIHSPNATLIIKVGSSGNVVWSKRIQGEGLSFVSLAYGVGGGCVLLFDHDPSHSIYLARLDSAGNLLWKTSLKDTSGSNTRGLGITQRDGGGFMIAGISGNEGVIASVNGEGKFIAGSHVRSVIEAPGFILQSDSGHFVLLHYSDGYNLALQLDENQSIPSCQLIEFRQMKNFPAGAITIANHPVTSRDWSPKQTNLTLQTFEPNSPNDVTLCFNQEIP